MSCTSWLRLVIEIDPTADPIQGNLRRPTGAAVPFAGWVALASAIERTLEDHQSANPVDRRPLRR